MLFKALVLGHVLLASAYENKALHELQADVDTLEKTLESGSNMEKKEMNGNVAPVPFARQIDVWHNPPTVFGALALTPDARHICDVDCHLCTRGAAGDPPGGHPDLTFVRSGLVTFIPSDDNCGCQIPKGTPAPLNAVISSAPVFSCVHKVLPDANGNFGTWAQARAVGEGKPGGWSAVSAGFYGEGGGIYWHGCSDSPRAGVPWVYQGSSPILPDPGDGYGPQQFNYYANVVTATGINLAHVCTPKFGVVY